MFALQKVPCVATSARTVGKDKKNNKQIYDR